MGKRKLIVGVTDLLTTHPDLCKEWDYEKNIDVTPQQVTSGAQKKVFWLCKEGHSWRAAIYSRASEKKPTGCPYCCNQKLLVGYNDLGTLYPELAAEWNYEKNYPLTPQDIIRGSHRKVWWKCKDGHEWPATVSDRVLKKHSCPFEAGKRVEPGYNDLLSQRPEVAKYWDYEKNYPLKPDEVPVFHSKKVYWRCNDCGHTWRVAVSSRTSKKTINCPQCIKGLKTSYAEQFIYFCMKELYSDTENRHILEGKEADIFVPGLNLAIEYDGCHFHGNAEAEGRDLRKTMHFQECGVTLLRVKEEAQSESITIAENIISIPKHDNKLDFLKEVMKNIVDWVNLKFNLSLELSVPDDIEQKVIEQMAVMNTENSLFAKYPEVAQYFHPTLNGSLRVDSVAANSHLNVWWLCPKCKEPYKMVVATRVRHQENNCECSHCVKLNRGKALAKAEKGVNDLASQCPEVLIDWDYEKNKMKPEELCMRSNKRVHWKCHKCGREWVNIVEKETIRKTRGCNICQVKKENHNEEDKEIFYGPEKGTGVVI